MSRNPGRRYVLYISYGCIMSSNAVDANGFHMARSFLIANSFQLDKMRVLTVQLQVHNCCEGLMFTQHMQMTRALSQGYSILVQWGLEPSEPQQLICSLAGQREYLYNCHLE